MATIEGVIWLPDATCVDVSNTASPAVTGVDAGMLAGDSSSENYIVAQIGGTQNILFAVGDSGSGSMLETVDVSDLANPQVLGSLATDFASGGGAPPVMVMLGEETLLMVRRNAGSSPNVMEAFDVSDLADLGSIATYDLGSAFAVAQDGHVGSAFVQDDVLAILSIHDSGATLRLGFYDVSDPAAITQIDTTDIVTGASSDLDAQLLGYFGDVVYLYVDSPSLTLTRLLRAYDVSTLASPSVLGSLSLASGTTGVFSMVDALTGFMAHSGFSTSTTNKTVHVIDWTAPASPTDVGNILPTTNRNFSMHVADSKLWLGTRKNSGSPNNRSLMIIDISTPATPALLGEVVVFAAGFNNWMALAEELSGPPEAPVTWLFPAHSSLEHRIDLGLPAHSTVEVGSRMDSSGLQASLTARGGDGTTVIVDVVSQTLDDAR